MNNVLPILIISVAVMLAAPLAVAETDVSPESIVREDVRTLNANDVGALLALFDEESRVFATPRSPDDLAGPLSTHIGTQAQRRETFARSAEGGPLRIEALNILSAGRFAVAKFRSSPPPDYTDQSYTLVLFATDGDVIRDLWHIARAGEMNEKAEAASGEILDQLRGAYHREYEQSPSELFSEGAKWSYSSGRPHSLADVEASPFPLGLTPGSVTNAIIFNDLIVLPLEDDLLFLRVSNGRISHVWTTQVGGA